MRAPQRWLRRAVLSALTGGGLTALGLTWPASGVAGAPAIRPPVSTVSESTTTTTTTSESSSSSASESTSTTSSSAPPSSSSPGPSPLSPSAPTHTTTGLNGSTSHPRKGRTHHTTTPVGPTVKQQQNQSSNTPQPSKKKGATKTGNQSKGNGGSHTPANVPSNITAAPQMVAGESGVLAALTKGLTVSTQALDLFYQVPPFLLPIYQAAAVQYGVPWEVLAAINEVETDYGNDLSVSTAGAIGWMQFMPQTWLQYGVDALDAGYADPYNPVDAIFAAGRYLAAAGASTNLRSAIFSYNHSEAYVESVLLRARLLASYPPSVIATLTGLVEGSPPLSGAHVVQSSVDASAFSAGPSSATGNATLAPTPAQAAHTASTNNKDTHAHSTSTPKNKLPEPSEFVELEAATSAPVVAVQNGRVIALGHSKTLGNYIALEDVYGDVFTYAGLGSVATRYRVSSTSTGALAPTAIAAASQTAAGPTPSEPASAGSQPPLTLKAKASSTTQPSTPAPATSEEPATGSSGKVLMFAHPNNPDARAAAARLGGHHTTYPKGWAPLRVGAVVSQGVTLGSSTVPTNAHNGTLRFAIRPAGDTTAVDPRAILANWDQLQHALHPQGAKGNSGLVGATASDVFLLSQGELERAVLAEPGIELPACARHEVASGHVDDRVLSLLLFLSRSGLRPTVSAVRCSSPNAVASSHSALEEGEGVDISKVNGIPIAGHQGAGTITDLTLRTLLTLQGRFAPHSIVSLMRYPAAPSTEARPDHADYIGIGFTPLRPTLPHQAAAATATAAHSAGPGATAPSPFAVSLGLGATGAPSPLTPAQWNQLLARIGALPQPKVATKPSSSAIRDPKSATSQSSNGSSSHH